MGNDDLKSMHIAVYALSLLGGTHRKVHTEEIAVKCKEIAPNRFRWEQFDYPDKELVRKALVHASEKKNGLLVTGRSGMEQRGKSRDGWQLTPAGAEWLHRNESLLQNGLRETPAAIPKREAERFLKKSALKRYLKPSLTKEAWRESLGTCLPICSIVARTRLSKLSESSSIAFSQPPSC